MTHRIRQLNFVPLQFLLLKLLCWVFLLVFISSLAFPKGSQTNVALAGFVPADTPASNLPGLFGLSDNHFYVQTGLDIADGGVLSSDSQFSLRQWAPGMPIILASLVWIFGFEVPLGIAYGIFSILLWSFVFFIFIWSCKTKLSLTFVFLSSILILGSSPYALWFFSGGYFYSEGPSIAFGILALLSLNLNHKLRLYLPGVFLALAAYFKGTFEFVGTFLSVVVLTYLVFILIKGSFKKRKFQVPRVLSADFLQILWLVIVFNILTIPWRIWSNINLYTSSFNLDWTAHTKQYWGHRWMPSDWLDKVGSSWFANNGGNSACILDYEKCEWVSNLELPSGGNYSGNGFFSQSQFLKLSMETFLQNPISWISSRIPFLQQAWFPKGSASKFEIWNFVFLFVFLAAIFIVIRNLLTKVQKSGAIANSLFFLSIVTGTLGPLLIQEIEPRYLYPVQLISFVMVMLSIRDSLNKINWKYFSKYLSISP